MRERVGHGEVGRRSVGDGVGGGAGDGAGDVDDEGVRRCPGREAGGGVGGVAGRAGAGPAPGAARPSGGRGAAAGGAAARGPGRGRQVGRPVRARVLIRRSVVRGGARYRLRRAGRRLVARRRLGRGRSSPWVCSRGPRSRRPRRARDRCRRRPGWVRRPRSSSPPQPGETVWEVASRVAPELSGPRRAALAERIVVDNALASVRLRPGQVLRVAAG